MLISRCVKMLSRNGTARLEKGLVFVAKQLKRKNAAIAKSKQMHL